MANPRGNSLLAQLPEPDYQRLMPHLQLIELRKGQVISPHGNPDSHFYFPVSCVLALRVEMMDGKSSDTIAIDNQGVYPIDMSGDIRSVARAVVRFAGTCYRLPAPVIRQALQENPRLLWTFLSSLVKLFERETLASACARRHTIDQITAKMILISLDRTPSEMVHLTHEQLSMVVGARRESITIVLKKFETSRLIASRKGRIEVIDRVGLEKRSCGCYRMRRDQLSGPGPLDGTLPG